MLVKLPFLKTFQGYRGRGSLFLFFFVEGRGVGTWWVGWE